MAKIEVFIAGTYLCEDIVKQVNEFACSKCDVVIYDLHPSNANTEMEDLAKRYGVQAVPYVVLNGNVIDVEKVKNEKMKAIVKTHTPLQSETRYSKATEGVCISYMILSNL